MIKFFINSILIIILVILQLSFFNSFDYPINILNIFLPVIIFIAIIFNYQLALYWSFFAGLLLSLFSILNFGIILISLILTVIIINFLFANFFTNKSLYSLLILGSFSLIIYNFLILVISLPLYFLRFNKFFFSLNWSYIMNLFWQILFALFILTVMFLTFKFLSKKLHSVFLISSQYDAKKAIK